jgi:4-hydroxy-tetrahydrodipicolinate synthase
VLPVLQTPFDGEGRIDLNSLARQIEWIFDAGAAGVTTGMVSELTRLSTNERRELLQEIVAAVAGRGPVVASVGAESTRQALDLVHDAAQLGCHALMAAPPALTRLPLEALRDHFMVLADATPLPLVVQDASAYVGQPIPEELLVELFERYGEEKILFKPEASPVGPLVSRLRDRTGGRARIFDGSGGIFLIDVYRRGVVGTMPGSDLVDAVVQLWRALERGDDQAAYRIYFPICGIVNLEMQAGLDGFLAIEKYILVRRGLFTSDRRRGPCGWSLDQETAAEVDRLLACLDEALRTPRRTRNK